MADNELIERPSAAKPQYPDRFSLLILAFAFCLGSYHHTLLWFRQLVCWGIRLHRERRVSARNPVAPSGYRARIFCCFFLSWRLAYSGKVPRYRAVFQTWAIAAGYILVLAPAQLPAYSAEQSTRVLRILLNLVFIVLLLGLAAIKRRRNPHRTISQRLNFRSIWPALLVAPLVIPGWLLWGAAGSALDVFLGFAEGLLLGLAVGFLLGQFLLPMLGQTSHGSGWDITLGGFVSGTALLMMSTGISLRGIQVQLMWVLPSLGWLLIAVSLSGKASTPERNWPGVAALVGLAASAAFIFVDPDELTLLLNLLTRDALFWANRAAWLGTVSAWLIGIILFLLRNRLPSWELSGKVKLGTGGVWLATVALFLLTGTRGLHGERLFVIMADQSDLSEISEIVDYNERRTQAYETLPDGCHPDSVPAPPHLCPKR